MKLNLLNLRPSLKEALDKKQIQIEELKAQVEAANKKLDECNTQMQSAAVAHSTLEGKKNLLRERERS